MFHIIPENEQQTKANPTDIQGGEKEWFRFFIELGQTLTFWGEALFCVGTLFDDACDNTLLLREAGSFLGSLERGRGHRLEGRRQGKEHGWKRSRRKLHHLG